MFRFIVGMMLIAPFVILLLYFTIRVILEGDDATAIISSIIAVIFVFILISYSYMSAIKRQKFDNQWRIAYQSFSKKYTKSKNSNVAFLLNYGKKHRKIFLSC